MCFYKFRLTKEEKEAEFFENSSIKWEISKLIRDKLTIALQSEGDHHVSLLILKSNLMESQATSLLSVGLHCSSSWPVLISVKDRKKIREREGEKEGRREEYAGITFTPLLRWSAGSVSGWVYAHTCCFLCQGTQGGKLFAHVTKFWTTKCDKSEDCHS